ncbi:MAG: DUF2264 domain-containing protein [Verrucomicrobiaceae bacterium]|nr:MAG: DUF2264 domain-containing protein [Verrucomicrobiaceae bacterium]
MNNRRHFLGTLLAASPLLTRAAQAQTNAAATAESRQASGSREVWTNILTRVIEPVLTSLAANQLKARMPVECPKGKLESRREVTHLEALGRTLAGAGPWLGVTGVTEAEEKTRKRFAELARQGLGNATDSTAADHLDFTVGGQNLVDAAFLAQGLARGRTELWEKLEEPVRQRLIAALQSTRRFKPGQSNWLLFSAMIEAFLASAGAEWKPEPVDTALRAHEEWYKGDGAYGDGPPFHWDYYNSYVIQPFLLDVLELLAPVTNRWQELHENILKRARRFAAVQERFVAPDGSFPPLGRSIVYRCGAFHHLAAMALRRQLPEEVSPAQVREALAAVIHRTLGAAGTFDDAGWLRIGLAGHQPALAESYISTGSLYLCTCAFLPLGLSPAEPFWSEPAADWTSKKIWSGGDLPADHAI